MPIKDSIGKRFGRLVVTDIFYKVFSGVKRRGFFKCVCDCGNEKDILSYSVTAGKTTSCGCVARERTARRATKHGMCNTREYRAYNNIVQRCSNKNNQVYDSYGGRGIKILWDSFEEFYRDMGLCPKGMNSIDRIDVNGHYCKENCRWANQLMQTRNSRKSCFWEYDGVKYESRRHAARCLGISESAVNKICVKTRKTKEKNK